jgi:hypothetical protein
VPLHIAQHYKNAFERAGAWVVIENWQTTQNPAVFDGSFVKRPADEPDIALEFVTARETSGELESIPDSDEPPAPDAEASEPVADSPEPRPHEVTLPPQPDRLTRWTPPAIAIGILLLAGSYVFGCVRVASTESRLEKEVVDLGIVLENHNARGIVVTPDVIVEDVQEIGRRVGVDIEVNEVDVSPEKIGVRRDPMGGCVVTSMPDTARHLPVWERDSLLRDMRSCDGPRWIVGIRVATRLRWGLYSQRVEFERFAPVLHYSEVDDEE